MKQAWFLKGWQSFSDFHRKIPRFLQLGRSHKSDSGVQTFCCCQTTVFTTVNSKRGPLLTSWVQKVLLVLENKGNGDKMQMSHWLCTRACYSINQWQWQTVFWLYYLCCQTESKDVIFSWSFVLLRLSNIILLYKTTKIHVWSILREVNRVFCL